MRFFMSLLAGTVLLSLSSTAVLADAKTETIKLHKSIIDSVEIFVLALNDVAETPKAAIPAIEQMVKIPVQKARFAWLDKMHASNDNSEYLPFFPCESSAVSLGEISSKYLHALNQLTKLPDLQLELKYFKEDLAECEAALGME